jgi:hypothetical protein
MTTTLKALGLALFAIAAMSMIAASAAQAGLGELHVTTPEKAVVTGEQVAGGQHVFQFGAFGSFICTQVKLEGTLEQKEKQQVTATEAQVTATYTGCQSLGAAATVKMNGCKYTLTGGVNEKTVQVDITGCTEGKKHILIETNLGCTITIPEQNNLSHITFTNEGEIGPKEDVLDHITIQGMTYEFTGVFCPAPVNVLHHDANYTGTTTIKAFKDLGSALKTHNGHEYKQVIEGEQVGLFAT